MTATKAASAMTFLHDKDIAHGVDLAFSHLLMQCDYACSLQPHPGTPVTPFISPPPSPPSPQACGVLQDLSGGNVKLTSCSINPHGFRAKVGDFGLSREANASARVAGNLYGTITHMAPEAMLQAQAGPVSMLWGGGGMGGGGNRCDHSLLLDCRVALSDRCKQHLLCRNISRGC